VARTVWDCLQGEVALAVGDETPVCVALSGGWDSRLVLQGARQLGRPIDCYTYGDDDLHETAVARRCAAAVGARHRAFAIAGHYFPHRHRFEALVRETEAANIPEWYPVLEGLEGEVEGRPLLLLGDHCESIDGRNMTSLSSRQARRSAFLRGLTGRPQEIPAATSARFREWRERKQRQVIRDVVASVACLSPILKSGCSEAMIARETEADLELSFQRVRDQNTAFAPMFEELFWWFHGIRSVRAGQNVMLSSRFRSASPVMSMRALRLISSVHPRLRVRRRLMDAIARLPEFDTLAETPSAQIPWVSARAPAFLRELIWGLRSGLDQWLIRRVMARKDPRGRQRVLRTTDLIAEYRREAVVPNVRDWFSGRWLDGALYVAVVEARACMEAWPLINADIAAPANTSILLDLCRVSPPDDTQMADAERGTTYVEARECLAPAGLNVDPMPGGVGE
jgi:hypothetical protein